MCTLRKRMSPATLNMRLFLKANRQLWQDARIIQEILDELTEQEPSDDEQEDGNGSDESESENEVDSSDDFEEEEECKIVR